MTPTRRAADVTPGQPVCTLLINIHKKSIHVPKHLVVVQVVNLPNTIAGVEISLIDFEGNRSSDMPSRGPKDKWNVIAALWYKLTIDRNTWIEQHRPVKKIDAERLKYNFYDKLHLSDKYTSYRKEFLTIIREFKSIACRMDTWTGSSVQDIGPGWLRRTSNPSTVRAAVRTKHRKLERLEIEKILLKQVIGPT